MRLRLIASALGGMPHWNTGSRIFRQAIRGAAARQLRPRENFNQEAAKDSIEFSNFPTGRRELWAGRPRAVT